MAECVTVAKTERSNPARQGSSNDVAGRETALPNVDGQFFALDVACTHAEGELAEGAIWGTTR